MGGICICGNGRAMVRLGYAYHTIGRVILLYGCSARGIGCPREAAGTIVGILCRHAG
jgi:hypothetical protein